MKIDARNRDSDYIFLSGAFFDFCRPADDSETGYMTLTLADDTTVNVVKIKSGITTTGDDSTGISLGELYYGTYYPAETQSPAGYTKLAAPIKLVLDGETKNKTRLYIVAYTKSGDTKNAGTITVGDSQVYEMPTAGGSGTAIYSGRPSADRRSLCTLRRNGIQTQKRHIKQNTGAVSLRIHPF